jgi:hypothetical protein
LKHGFLAGLYLRPEESYITSWGLEDQDLQ